MIDAVRNAANSTGVSLHPLTGGLSGLLGGALQQGTVVQGQGNGDCDVVHTAADHLA